MMPTAEQIAAFADGQLDGAERDAVAAAVAADPALQQQVDAHRALRARLAGHFAPVAAQPVPDRLAALLAQPEPQVIDLAAARAKRRGAPRWVWIASPALAASLALAVLLTRPDDRAGADLAGPQIAAALSDQLVSEQSADAPVRVLLSFRDQSGTLCRAFTGAEQSGIACREGESWKLRTTASGSQQSGTAYRQAGSDAEVMQAAQAMAVGPALDADAERAARDAGWARLNR